MLYLYIYIALFAGTLILAVWNSHNKVKHHSCQEGYPSFLGLKTQEPAWLLLLFSGITAPFIVPLLIARGINRLCRRIRYHNRPKPVPKNMRQHLNADTVLDEDNSAMSIAEYNRKHHTNFTLEQVYGKRYADSIPTE